MIGGTDSTRYMILSCADAFLVNRLPNLEAVSRFGNQPEFLLSETVSEYGIQWFPESETASDIGNDFII